MIIIKPTEITRLVQYLRAGKTVVFPTETSYGLGCDATNQLAVNKIFKIKGRDKDKPLLVVAPTIKMAKSCLYWSKILSDIAGRYWPGALTVVGKYKNNRSIVLASGVVSSTDTVAIRVTSYPFLKTLSRRLGRPLVATSANVSGQPDICDSAEVDKIFAHRKNQPDVLVVGGKLPRHKPSTMIKIVGDKVELLRQGEVRIV